MGSVLAKLLWLAAQFLWDWLAMGVRVRKLLSNDLPHMREEIREEIRDVREKVEENRTLLDKQIGYCRGVRDTGPCPRSPHHPLTPSPDQ